MFLKKKIRYLKKKIKILLKIYKITYSVGKSLIVFFEKIFGAYLIIVFENNSKY